MVDDGSTDCSRSIANSFAEKDNRFRLFIQKNAGVSAARNYGLDIAKGEYILFVDSDDWLESQMVERLVDNMNIYCRHYFRCEYGIFRTCPPLSCGLRIAERTYLCDRLSNGRSAA